MSPVESVWERRENGEFSFEPRAAVCRRVLDITTQQGFEFIDLTARVEQEVSESGIEEGTVFVQSRHTTAALLLNEWQEALLHDVRTLLEHAVPGNAAWRHNDSRYSDCTRGNAVSHLRAMLLGNGAMLPVSGGRVMRGTWQSIILAEMDGPRNCSVVVQVAGLDRRMAAHKPPPPSPIAIRASPGGRRTSEFWEAWFRRSLDNPPAIPWESAGSITDAERGSISASIQEFQLGEQSEGRHLRGAARDYSRRSGDAAYSRAMALFIREEQHHAALLGRFMDRAGIPRVRQTWVDSIFRSLRRFAGLETSICVLLTAEIIAKVYYAALAASTACPALRAICNRILEDESSHLEFQSERLAILRRHRSRPLIAAAVAFQRVLFGAAVAVVWRRHKPVLQADNDTFGCYWRRCHQEFRQCLKMMKPS